MKKTIGIATLLVAVMSVFVFATEKPSETHMRSFSTEEIAKYESYLTDFKEVNSMEVVEIKGEDFLRVTGLSLEQSTLIQTYAYNEDCEGCTVKVNGVPMPGIKVGPWCWVCEEHTPIPE